MIWVDFLNAGEKKKVAQATFLKIYLILKKSFMDPDITTNTDPFT